MSQVRQNVDRRGKCETHSLKMWIRVASLHSDARLRIALQSPQNALQSHFRVSLQFREENSARGEFCCLESRILSFWQNVKGQNVRSKLNSSRVSQCTHSTAFVRRLVSPGPNTARDKHRKARLRARTDSVLRPQGQAMTYVQIPSGTG